MTIDIQKELGIAPRVREKIAELIIGEPEDGTVDNAALVDDIKVGSLATLTTTEKSSVVGAINEIDDAMATKTGSETLTNKTLTAPKISDGDLGVTITSANQTSSVANIIIPNCGDAADEFVLKDTAQTLTNKTLTSPVVSALKGTLNSFAVDFAGGYADYTLGANVENLILTTSNFVTDGANSIGNILGSTVSNQLHVVYNGSSVANVLKVAGQTGVTIPAGKMGVAVINAGGTDYVGGAFS